MGQDEIIMLLEDYKGKWFTVKQIHTLLSGSVLFGGSDISMSSVSISLGRLRKQSWIKYKPNPRRKSDYLYSFKKKIERR